MVLNDLVIMKLGGVFEYFKLLGNNCKRGQIQSLLLAD